MNKAVIILIAIALILLYLKVEEPEKFQQLKEGTESTVDKGKDVAKDLVEDNQDDDEISENSESQVSSSNKEEGEGWSVLGRPDCISDNQCEETFGSKTYCEKQSGLCMG